MKVYFKILIVSAVFLTSACGSGSTAKQDCSKINQIFIELKNNDPEGYPIKPEDYTDPIDNLFSRVRFYYPDTTMGGLLTVEPQLKDTGIRGAVDKIRSAQSANSKSLGDQWFILELACMAEGVEFIVPKDISRDYSILQ
jgi:hypothetical protein